MKRNQTRDYLDVAGLSDRFGTSWAADVLAGIDDYYTDPAQDNDAVASQLVRQLADPQPADSRTTGRLADYKGLSSRYRDWNTVREIMAEVAENMLRPEKDLR